MARGALGTQGTRSARSGMGQVPGQAQRAWPAAEAPVLILPPRAGSFRVWPPRSPRLQPASPGARTPVTTGPALRHASPGSSSSPARILEKEHREVLVLSFSQVALSSGAQLFRAAL